MSSHPGPEATPGPPGAQPGAGGRPPTGPSGERTLDGKPISRPTPAAARPAATVTPGHGRSGSLPPSVGWTGQVPPPVVNPIPGAPYDEQPPGSARPTPPQARPAGAARPAAAPRRARLIIRTIDPWSVLKLALVYSVCLLVVGVVAVAIIYGVLAGLGVFDSLSKFLDTVTDAGPGTSSSSSSHSFSAVVVIGGSAVVLAVNALLLTALATLGAFLYNLCASFVGGIEVTLSEPD